MKRLKSIYSKSTLLIFYIPLLLEEVIRTLYSTVKHLPNNLKVNLKYRHRRWLKYWDIN